MYKVIDLQLAGREFWGGHIFKTEKEIVNALASYHDIDFTGTDDKDNELSIEEYFEFWGINTIQERLSWLCEYGEWEVKKI